MTEAHNYLIQPPRGIRIDPAAARRKQLSNGALIGIPLVGSIYSVFHFQSNVIGPVEIACFLIFYLATGIGIGIGFHRCFTHQSFRPVRWLKRLLLFLGSIAFQGPAIRWVADHRRHHQFADHSWDTHSPVAYKETKIRSRLTGLLHAHLGWMFDDTTTEYEVYAPDLVADKDAVFFERYYIFSLFLSLAMPWTFGLALSGSDSALNCLLLGGCVRTTLFHNVVWAVNSLGHSFGRQDESTRDSSRNSVLLAAATFGEGWHNNHHASPRTAYNRVKWYQLDINGWLIWMLAKAGLVEHVIICRTKTSHVGGIIMPTDSTDVS